MTATHALDQARTRVLGALDTTQDRVGDAVGRARKNWEKTSKRLEKRARRFDKDLQVLDKRARRASKDLQKQWTSFSRDARKTYDVASKNARHGYDVTRKNLGVASTEVDRYVHKNPRTATLLGAGVGVLLGLLLSKR